MIQTSDDRSNFSASSFMKNVYVFGGFTTKFCLKSCYKYDTKRSNWIPIAIMDDFRQNATCTVFKVK